MPVIKKITEIPSKIKIKELPKGAKDEVSSTPQLEGRFLVSTPPQQSQASRSTGARAGQIEEQTPQEVAVRRAPAITNTESAGSFYDTRRQANQAPTPQRRYSMPESSSMPSSGLRSNVVTPQREIGSRELNSPNLLASQRRDESYQANLEQPKEDKPKRRYPWEV